MLISKNRSNYLAAAGCAIALPVRLPVMGEQLFHACLSSLTLTLKMYNQSQNAYVNLKSIYNPPPMPWCSASITFGRTSDFFQTAFCVLLRCLLYYMSIDETLRLHSYMPLFGTFHKRSESGPVESKWLADSTNQNAWVGYRFPMFMKTNLRKSAP